MVAPAEQPYIIDDTIDLRKYLLGLLRWWWLIAATALLGAAAAYVIVRNTPPVYEASTLLMVGGGLNVANPTAGELQTSEKLAHTYAQLVKTAPVLDATAAALGLSPGAFRGRGYPRVSVELLSLTQLMRVTVADTSPARAAAAADELSRQMILQSPSGPERQERAYREFVSRQLDQLAAEIDWLTQALAEADERGDLSAASSLQGELKAQRSTYSEMLGYYQSSATNHLSIVEHARVPIAPVSPNVLRSVLLGAVAGATLASLAVLGVEFLDRSIRSGTEAEDATGLPTLGHVIRLPRAASRNGVRHLLTADDLISPEAESFRMLHMNLRYSLPSSSEKRAFLVTSAAPSSGKTTVAANLAVIAALAGQRVVLVDADMRRPRLQKVFGRNTSRGLSSLLVGEVDDLDAVLQPTDTEGLSLLPCGTVPPNPAELLDSARMGEVLDALRQRFDLLILDTPPVLAVTDASLLSRSTSGAILVIEYGRTTTDAAKAAVETLQRVNGKVLGGVLNRVPPRQRFGYGYGTTYQYQYAYGYADRDGKSAGRRLASLFRRERQTADSRGRNSARAF